MYTELGTLNTYISTYIDTELGTFELDTQNPDRLISISAVGTFELYTQNLLDHLIHGILKKD